MPITPGMTFCQCSAQQIWKLVAYLVGNGIGNMGRKLTPLNGKGKIKMRNRIYYCYAFILCRLNPQYE